MCNCRDLHCIVYTIRFHCALSDENVRTISIKYSPRSWLFTRKCQKHFLFHLAKRTKISLSSSSFCMTVFRVYFSCSSTSIFLQVSLRHAMNLSNCKQNCQNFPFFISFFVFPDCFYCLISSFHLFCEPFLASISTLFNL